MLLLAQLTHHYGFLGINGLAGIIVGLIILIILAAILWKLFFAVMAALGLSGAWVTVIYWLLVLLTFVIFLHFFGLY
jgi:hypothetical protein